MSDFKIFYQISFVLFVYVSTRKGAQCDYTNTWVIETDNEENAKRIAKKYDFEYGGKIGSLDGFYLLMRNSVPRRRRRSVLQATRILRMDPSVKWSAQQKILTRVKRDFHDPLYKDQWYLKNNVSKHRDINVTPVWRQGITGRGVVVTILDDGIEFTHPDLKSNYDARASYDYNGRDSNPSPKYTPRNTNRHGTRCAGEVAAAANNDVCGVGVAYNAGIGGIRMLDGDVTDAVEGSSLSHARNYIDIYSSSWGPEDKGVKVDGPGKTAKEALKKGVNEGRNGKGSIFVWATGNGGDYNDYCNCDGYITSIYTISIGAVNDLGKSPWYAEPCPSTLAVTFSSGKKNRNTNKKIATTDLYHMCTKSHTGTSAAAPLAAGIFALVLEANPDLTWRDLQHLIVETSRMTDKMDPDWHVNGVGFHVNNKYGFGLLDTANLVKRARDPGWRTATTQHMCYGDDVIYNRKIRANKVLTSTITTDGCMSQIGNKCVTKLEHVVAYVTLQHERRGSLIINLISPSGTKSKLLGLRKLDFSNKGFKKWPFMTVFNWGENPRGTWKLEIVSTDDLIGTFKGWYLNLYGTCSHQFNYTAHENHVCDKYCKKGCPENFKTACRNCVKFCDCTTGKCTRRCRRGLVTDPHRHECSNASRRHKNEDLSNNNHNENKQRKRKKLPQYGLWLLISAGTVVSFGIIAGVWQGWLYYSTREKLNRVRRQNQMVHSNVPPQYTMNRQGEHVDRSIDRTSV